MKYFLDTEFIEKKGSITLISIGIVCEDGREYHAISNEWSYKDAGEWVKKNVILPLYISTVRGDARNRFSIERFQNHYGISNNQIATQVTLFCNPVTEKEFTKNEFFGYFADYDWVVFCWLFGTMMDLPKGFPMYCTDLKQMMNERGLTEEWKEEHCPDPADEHNALADARWNKKLYDKIISQPTAGRVKNARVVEALKRGVDEENRSWKIMCEVNKEFEMRTPEKLAWVKQAEAALQQSGSSTTNKPRQAGIDNPHDLAISLAMGLSAKKSQEAFKSDEGDSLYNDKK